jgi:hypothetical protein
MTTIQTKDGLIDEADLTKEFIQSEDDAAVCVAIEWRHKESGELLRRDVWVNAKRGLEMGVTPGAPGG